MSLHADARRVLADWTVPDATQRQLRDAYLDHLDAHPDGMWRDCRPDHLTASVLVLSAGLDRVLLTLHARIGRWLQLGGHCERTDATLVEAALREGREESGIHDLRIDPVPVLLSHHEVPCGPVRPAHHLDVQYVATAPIGAEHGGHRISSESADLAWFGLTELPGTDDSVRALVAAASARLPAARR